MAIVRMDVGFQNFGLELSASLRRIKGTCNNLACSKSMYMKLRSVPHSSTLFLNRVEWNGHGILGDTPGSVEESGFAGK